MDDKIKKTNIKANEKKDKPNLASQTEIMKREWTSVYKRKRKDSCNIWHCFRCHTNEER